MAVKEWVFTSWRTTLMIGVCLLSAGCGSDDNSSVPANVGPTDPVVAPNTAPTTSTSTSRAVPGGTTGDTSTATMPVVDPELPIIAPAREDLARRLRVDEGSISVLLAERLTWPDASLGCPEPGVSYAQRVVEGSRVLLQHAQRVYAYHAGADDQPFLCPSGEADGGRDFVPPPGYDV
jgi:hypothetical protein